MLDFETCRRLKTCSKCKVNKPITDFNFQQRPDEYSSHCKLCSRKRGREYYAKDPAKHIKQKLAWQRRDPEKSKALKCRTRRRLKVRTLRAYGGGKPACACCGEDSLPFLCIDHINGGGGEHFRSENLRGGATFYHWLKKNSYPPGFQVLCFNCNMAKHFFGACPHKEPVDHLYADLNA